MSDFITSNTKKFTDIYGTVSAFTSDYSTISLGGISDSTLLNKLYYLLYAKFGNSCIANLDETQFKYKLFSVIFMYGPTWEKRLSIQNTLRGLTDSQIKEGSFQIYNHALNPSTAPTTNSTTELPYINSQDTNRYSKSPIEGYANLWSMLATDVTAQFLERFNICFKQFVRPVHTILYGTEEDDNE